MTFLGRAWRYIFRKRIKTLIIFAILTAMLTALITTGAVTRSAGKVGEEVAQRTGAGFVLQNNPQTNPGTARGAGTVRGADIKKIARLKEIKNYVARQNVTADLVNAKVQRLAQQEYDAKKEAQFGNAANVWGVNESALDNNFRSGALKLAAGRHLKPTDRHKALIHEDLAKANGLKPGSKITLKANPYDADNQKKSTAQTQAEIVGLISGKNPRPAAQRSELFANIIYTDLQTTRELYAMTPQDEIYQDANFFVKKADMLEDVAKKAWALDIDRNGYMLARSTQYLAGITGAAESIQSTMKATKIAVSVLAAAILSLVLFLWLSERRKETGVLLSVGVKKIGILTQYFTELVMIAIPAFILSRFCANALAQKVGNSVLGSANASIQQGFGGRQQAGADIESSMAVQTLRSLHVHPGSADLISAGLLALGIIALCIALSSLPMLRKPPRELLVNIG